MQYTYVDVLFSVRWIKKDCMRSAGYHVVDIGEYPLTHLHSWIVIKDPEKSKSIIQHICSCANTLLYNSLWIPQLHGPGVKAGEGFIHTRRRKNDRRVDFTDTKDIWLCRYVV